MNDEEIVNVLRRHYKENVLEPEPNPKVLELKEQLLSNPSTFKETVAKGLNKGCYWKLGEVYESDLDGAEVLELDSDVSLMAIKIPEKVMEKLGFIGADGMTFDRNVLEKNSPFHGINVVLVIRNAATNTDKHEKSHVVYNERSRPYKDVRSEQICRIDETTKRLIDRSDESYWKIASMEYEMGLLKEIAAGGIAERNESVMSFNKRWFYPAVYAKYLAGEMDQTDILPDCGRISRHAAAGFVEKSSFNYFKSRFDAGIEAFKILREALPEKKVERIIETCGPTKEEFTSGKYTRPVDELVLWSRHYNEVLGVRNGGQ